MKDTSVIFDEAASRADARVRFLLTLPGIGPDGITFSSWNDDDYPCRWDLIKEVGQASGKIKPNEGSADISSLIVKIIDDERVHQIVPAIPRRTRAILYAGFAGIFEADFSTVITGLIEEPKLEVETGLWSLRLNDLRYYEINDVFRSFGKTHLNGALAAGAVTADVDSTDASAAGDQAFHDPATSETNGWALIDGKEIVSFGALNAAQLTGLSRGQMAAAGGWPDMDHDDGAEVQELFALTGNPIDIYLKMLTSTGAGTNGAYDVWESDQGLGVDEDLVDVSSFETERDRYLPTDTYRFIIKEPIKNAGKWAQKEIFKTINAYPLVTGSGKISFRLYNPPFAEDPETVTEADIISAGTWNRGLAELINNTHFSFDYDIVDGEPRTHRYDLQAESINEHGLSKAWECEARGLYTDLSASAIINRRVNRIFIRYKDGAPSFSAKALLGKFKLDAGDIVEVTHSWLPDLARGVRGIASKLMEIVQAKINTAKGEIDFTFLDTRLAGKYGMICPDTYPTYALATEVQKKYAYICDTATEKMPDGDDPTLIL